MKSCELRVTTLRQLTYSVLVSLLCSRPDTLGITAVQSEQGWQQQLRILIRGFTWDQGRKVINGNNSQFWVIDRLGSRNRRLVESGPG